MFTGSLYTLHSVVFAVSGFLIMNRLKWYFPDFYNENWGIILIATIALSFSLILRGILDLIRLNNSARTFMYSHENIFNGILFVCCDIIPIYFQLFTLIFGFIRKRQERKQKLSLNYSPNQVQNNQRESENNNGERFMSSMFNISGASASSNSSYFDPPLQLKDYAGNGSRV